MINKLVHSCRLVLLTITFCISCLKVFSQTPRGITLESNESVQQGKTRALIVGISRYQYIDSLEFADADAKVFADYLLSNSFWRISKDDITLLVNDKAKYGDLTVHLQQLAMQCKPGDNLLFYFSGHGDVETNTLFNRGFLLAYDTYSSNYMANGLRVDDLKDLFVTLLTNNVRVIVVTDACRSGKLAGGMKGAEFTAASISAMWKNEIKILSTQPGQLSYEDKKWGNGRGVFSYYLIKGLNGEADANKDSSITLSELEMYVGSNVARETGNKQQPIFEGPNKFSTIIAKISGPVTNSNKQGGNAFSALSKGIILPFDSCNYYYTAMANAIEKNNLIGPGKESATNYYDRLRNCSADNNFILKANGELLSALMNKAQEKVNNSFIGKTLVSYEKFREGIQVIDQIFRYNDLNLPYMPHWKNLRRYLFVQGEALWNDNRSTFELEKIIDSATAEEPDAAYLFTAKGIVEMRKENWETAIKLLEKSIEKSPGWLIPKYYLGICHSKRFNYRKALEYYEQVLQKDKSYKTFECTKCILLNMAEYAFRSKQHAKGLQYLFMNIDQFPDHWEPYELLYSYALEKKDSSIAKDFIKRLNVYNDTASMRLLRLRFEHEFYKRPLSIKTLEESILILNDNIDSADYFYTLGLYYEQKNSYDADSAMICYLKAADLDKEEVFYITSLGDFMEKEGMMEELQEILEERITLFTGEDKGQLQELLANSYLATNDYEKALNICKELLKVGYLKCSDMRKLKKAFKGFTDYEKIMKECKEE